MHTGFSFANMAGAAPAGLPGLEQRLKHDLECLCWPADPWMPALMHNGTRVLDVVIIGAGQAGLAAAAALQQQGINATIVDRAQEGFEGPWATTARMETLRSPKHLTGPALGLPALTFRAWFEAQFGNDAWQGLDKIPRLQWMEYLRWYRRVMGIEVLNETAVTKVMPSSAGLVRLSVRTPRGDPEMVARRVVLATGRDGLGGAAVPGFTGRLQRKLWAHSSEAVEYGLLKGKRVGVVGAGSSAMDSAASALEAGAASVDLLIRRNDIPRINKSKAAGIPGLTHGHSGLPDMWKWRIRHYINVQQVPPPRGSTLRVSRHPNARFNLGCPVLDVQDTADGIKVLTPKGVFELDFLIVSTGFRIDWNARPEFSAIAPCLRSWRDRYRPEPGEEDLELSDSPDLGPAFELREKAAGMCPGLERIHCFCYPATASHGAVSGDIPGISDGARRLAEGIAGLFYREDVEYHFSNLQAYSEPEVHGNEWVPAPPPRAQHFNPINTGTLMIQSPTSSAGADVLDQVLGISSPDKLSTLRAQRAKVAHATQASYEAMFDPALKGLSVSERLLVALYACRLSRAAELAEHYRGRLLDLETDLSLLRAVDAIQAPAVDDPRLRAVLHFTRVLIEKPIEGDQAALAALQRAHLSTPAIVALAQLVAFLSYQVRIAGGLKALQTEEAAA